jgi:hypothetical protein
VYSRPSTSLDDRGRVVAETLGTAPRRSRIASAMVVLPLADGPEITSRVPRLCSFIVLSVEQAERAYD